MFFFNDEANDPLICSLVCVHVYFYTYKVTAFVSDKSHMV